MAFAELGGTAACGPTGSLIGATFGIIAVVEGGIGTLGVCSWATGLDFGLLATGTSGFSGTIGSVPRTTTGFTPGRAGPVRLSALAFPTTGIMPVISPVGSTPRTA